MGWYMIWLDPQGRALDQVIMANIVTNCNQGWALDSIIIANLETKVESDQFDYKDRVQENWSQST